MKPLPVRARRALRPPVGIPGEPAGSIPSLRMTALFLGLVLVADPAPASEPVARVEEDWVVQIDVPDPAGHAPQILTAMSSTGQLADVHMVFELNHCTLPSYTAGGMQIQCWSGEQNLDYKTGPKTEVLATTGEQITFTSSMRISSGYLTFEILNGTSTTWGTFANYGWLKTSVPTTQTAFTAYSPSVSVANSRVGFASHRVKKLALKEVRYYSATDTLISTDTTERVVHSLP
ncbi:MAG: hypothetical protein KY476_19405 [Planctomycetes bacterium]|nr:hypothetical protein [Planctomycetota bacterium]